MAWRKPWIRVRKRARNQKTYQVMYWEAGRRIVDSSWHERDFAESRRTALEQELNARSPGAASPVSLPESLPGPLLPVPGEAQPPSTSPGYRRLDNPSVPWSTFIADVLEARGLKDRTRAWYRGIAMAFARAQAIEYLHEVTAESLKEFLEGVRRTRSAATVSSYAGVLTYFLKELTRPDLVAVCRPFKPHKTFKRARPHLYSPEELGRLIAACEDLKTRRFRNKAFWKAFLLLLYHTGLRRDEACHLQWDDIQGDVLHVRPKSTPIPWTPKSEKSRRTLPVPAVVLDALASLPRETPYVFVSRVRLDQVLQHLKRRASLPPGSLLLNCLSKQFKAIRERAGLREGTLHDFRRTYITRLLQHLAPHEVQVLAGHEDLETTLGIYAEVQRASVVQRARLVI